LIVVYTSDLITFPPAPLKLRPYGALRISLILLLLLLLLRPTVTGMVLHSSSNGVNLSCDWTRGSRR